MVKSAKSSSKTQGAGWVLVAMMAPTLPAPKADGVTVSDLMDNDWLAAKLAQLTQESDGPNMRVSLSFNDDVKVCLWHSYLYGKPNVQLVAKWLLAGTEEAESPTYRLRRLKKAGIIEHDCLRVLSLANLLKEGNTPDVVHRLKWAARNIAIEQYLQDHIPNERLNVLLSYMTHVSFLKTMEDSPNRSSWNAINRIFRYNCGRMLASRFKGDEREVLEQMFWDVCNGGTCSPDLLYDKEEKTTSYLIDESACLAELSKVVKYLESSLSDSWISWDNAWRIQASSNGQHEHDLSKLWRLAKVSHFNEAGVADALAAFDTHHVTDDQLLAIAAKMLVAPLGIKALLSEQDLALTTFWKDEHVVNLMKVWPEETQRKKPSQLNLEVLRKLFGSVEMNAADAKFLKTANHAQLASDFAEAHKRPAAATVSS